MISLRNLCRKYGDLVAVDGVSLDIRKGEIVGLLGHNGAGKTTVMRILTGFLEPTAGAATIDGLDVTTHRPEVQARLGYLPENAPVYPEMVVADYLRWMAELRGVAPAAIESAVAEAARKTGLDAHMQRTIGTLSKGYRQRVGLAQAIVHSPPVLILDEPTSGLDPLQIQAIRTLIRDLAATSTVILSTHILQEVEAVCDRVVVMIGGRLAADAPLAELLRSNVLRLALGDAADGVEQRLSKVGGVRAVRRGADSTWSIDCEPGTSPAPAVLRAAVESGWTVHELAREQRTLQSVFERLQQEHAARLAASEGATA